MKLIPLLLLVINPIIAWANLNADSLNAEWNNEAQTDSLRLDAVHKLAMEVHLYSNPDTALYYAQQQLEYAKAVNSKYHMALAINTFGNLCLHKKEYIKALAYYEQSLELRRQMDDLKGICRSLSNIAVVYINTGQVAKGLDYYSRIVKRLERIDDSEFKAVFLGNIGIFYAGQGNLEAAINYYNQSLGYFNAIGKETHWLCIKNHFRLALIFYQKKQFDKALEIFEKALKITIKKGDKNEQAAAHIYIGATFYEQKNFEDALRNYDQALLTLEAANNTLVNGAYESGEKLTIRLGKGLIHVETGEYSSAINECAIVYKYAIDQKLVSLEKESCDCLYKAYKGKGDGIEALKYLERYQTLDKEAQERLKANDFSKELQQMEFEKQVLKDSIENAKIIMLEKEAEENIKLQKQRKNRIQYSLVVIVVLLLATVIAVATRFSISPSLASGLIFIFFILTFEFLLVVLDPWVDSISNGEVGWKIGINTAIALVLFGVHQVSEKRLKNALIKKDKT